MAVLSFAKSWRVFCAAPEVEGRKVACPYTAGGAGCNLVFGEGAVGVAWRLEAKAGEVYLVSGDSQEPVVLDGEEVAGSTLVPRGADHRVEWNGTVVVLSEKKAIDRELLKVSSPNYVFRTAGTVYGPMDALGLHNAYHRGELRPESEIWLEGVEWDVHGAREWIRFEEDEGEGGTSGEGGGAPAGDGYGERAKTAEEMVARPGESFACPYCRRISSVGDVFSVSVSPGLLGDEVLGPAAQRRFLPSKFTRNGLALDAEGGICPEVACPHCHMTLSPALLEREQAVLSVVGAPSSGKSFFLASAIWQCRQVLPRKFGVSFTDLDPVANRWINEYEEKLFFADGGEDELRKIEKTDVGESAVLKQVLIGGVATQLPLPSFFRVRGGGKEEALVVYDSAGEHFQAGADTGGSLVTLNMLGADVLYFLYDPSADVRFDPYLDRGTGTARRRAQRQDTLLSEMAARIRRHTGDWGGEKLRKPVIFGISKADMLRRVLDFSVEPYRTMPDGHWALDLEAIERISRATEAFVESVAPETVLTARELAENVWFLPMSALGHNPMQEGVRPADVKPIWAELPLLMALARRGIVPVAGGE